MKHSFIALLVGLFAPSLFAQVDPNTVYGDDDRRDLYQVTSPAAKKLAESTVGLFSAGNVTVDPAKGVAALATSSYSEEYNLCPEEPFFSQRTGAFCSGSLVAPDIIMTAGHCVRDQGNCTGTKFVFGFGIYEEGGKTPESVPASDVYGCAQLLGREQVNDGADWALVRLDRAVSSRKPLALNRSGVIAKGTGVFVIGHPAGLPTKIAGGASVRNADLSGYFTANTDTFGGNSGSAVFNAQSGLVEGILVRGEQDYIYKGNCRISNPCPNDGCRGEDVTKISAVMSKIPAPRSEDLARLVKPGAALASLLDLAALEGSPTPR